MNRTYLDHAASTPLLPEAVEAITRELTRTGNASALHGSGRAARRRLEEAREQIAAAVGAKPAEVILTSGGTESDNLAVKGGYWSRRAEGRTKAVVSAIEHHAVLDSAQWLASTGAEVAYAPVDAEARVDLAALDDLLDERTAVVSVMWANNEVGTLQPVAEVAELARRRQVLSHSDAVQAVGHVEVDFEASGLDLLTFTGHKLGGPVGVGALLARREVTLTSVQHGGGQERDVRSGTLDVPAVAGFAAALDVAVHTRAAEQARVGALRSELVAAVRAAVPEVVVYGPADPAAALPGIASLGFPGCSADALLMLLDAAGVDCSAGSACSAGVSAASHVLLALGCPIADARSVLRFSLGHTSTAADITTLIAALPEAVLRSRAAAAYA